MVQSRQISIEHLGTNSMISDALAKGLPLKVFHDHIAHMGVLWFEEYLIFGELVIYKFYILCLVLCMHTLVLDIF